MGATTSQETMSLALEKEKEKRDLPTLFVKDIYTDSKDGPPEKETISNFALAIFRHLLRTKEIDCLGDDISLYECVFVAGFIWDAQKNKDVTRPSINLKENGDKSVTFAVQLMHGQVRTSDVKTIYQDDARYEWNDECDVCTFKNTGNRLYSKVHGSTTELTVTIVRLPDVEMTTSWYTRKPVRTRKLFKTVKIDNTAEMETKSEDSGSHTAKSLTQTLDVGMWSLKTGFIWNQYDDSKEAAKTLSNGLLSFHNHALLIELRHENEKEILTSHASGLFGKTGDTYGVLTVFHVGAPEIESPVNPQKLHQLGLPNDGTVNWLMQSHFLDSTVPFNPTHRLVSLRFTNLVEGQNVKDSKWYKIENLRDGEHAFSRNFFDGFSFFPIVDESVIDEIGRDCAMDFGGAHTSIDLISSQRIHIIGYPQFLKPPYFSIFKNGKKTCISGSMQLASTAFGLEKGQPLLTDLNSIGVSQVFSGEGLSGSGAAGSTKDGSVVYVGNVVGNIMTTVNNAKKKTQLDIIKLRNDKKTCEVFGGDPDALTKSYKKVFSARGRVTPELNYDDVELPVDKMKKRIVVLVGKTVGTLSVVSVLGYACYRYWCSTNTKESLSA